MAFGGQAGSMAFGGQSRSVTFGRQPRAVAFRLEVAGAVAFGVETSAMTFGEQSRGRAAGGKTVQRYQRVALPHRTGACNQVRFIRDRHADLLVVDLDESANFGKRRGGRQRQRQRDGGGAKRTRAPAGTVSFDARAVLLDAGPVLFDHFGPYAGAVTLDSGAVLLDECVRQHVVPPEPK